MTESVESRIAFLRERVATAQAAPSRSTFDVPFRQRQVPLVKVEVPIEFPLYNIQSGRTHRAQTAWLEQNSADHGFFDDPEDDSVQRVQHELLLSMISERGLNEDLENREQRNPIVLTYDGFIVDGNRRVAALRYQGNVENVLAVVLPSDALASEIFETELELQMARETRAEYNWVDQALHVRYGIRQLHEGIPSVATRMNVPVSDVESVLALLALVDQYLEWHGTPEAYHRVPGDSEQSFIELAQRDGRPQARSLPADLRLSIKQASFAVIQSEEGGYMDVRRVADGIRNQPGEVVARLRDRLPTELQVKLDTPPDPQPPSTDGDLLSRLANSERQDVVTAGTELINVLGDPSDAVVSGPILMDVARELDDERRDGQLQRAPLRKLEQALRLMRTVHIEEETQSLETLATRLSEIDTEIERLTQELRDSRS